MTSSRSFTSLAAAAVLSSACHADFPDRLRNGCGTVPECEALVREATARLGRCAGYPNGPRTREEWRSARDRCPAAYSDRQAARELYTKLTWDGDPLYRQSP